MPISLELYPTVEDLRRALVSEARALLKPFEPISECPKCGREMTPKFLQSCTARDVLPDFNRFGYSNLLVPIEYLLIVCVCGYSFRMRTKDDPEPD